MYKEIARHVKNAKKLFVLTGSGISAPSHIPTFNGPNGFWSQFGGADPGLLLRKITIQKRPEEVWQWINKYRLVTSKAQPNEAHKSLLKLQEHYYITKKNLTFTTLNFDNLHAQLLRQSTVLKEHEALLEGTSDLADLNNLIELRGNINYMRCSNDCSYSLYYTPEDLKRIPKCPQCKAVMRPHILLFDEGDSEVYYRSVTGIGEALKSDCMIVIGSGLESQLASCLVQEHIDERKLLIEININKVIKEKKESIFHIGESCEKSVPKLVNEIVDV